MPKEPFEEPCDLISIARAGCSGSKGWRRCGVKLFVSSLWEARAERNMAGKLAPPLNTEQVERAVDALLNHVQRTKKTGGKEQLFDSADPISVLIGMKSIPATGGRTKPYLIELKHPLMDPAETEVCLIVKDPQREFKDKIEAKGITSVKKVIGVSKLRAKFKQYEAKRQLCSSYDLFLADDRVLPMLPHLIGKVFFEKKKQPLPVKLTRENWDRQFKNIFNATPFYLAEGLCSTIKAGHTGMDRAHIVGNIVSALDKVAEILPKKWKGIQAVHIKTHDSIALPIYHSLPTGIAIEAPTAHVSDEKTAGKRKSGDANGDEDEEDEQVGAKRRRSEKRAAERRSKKGEKIKAKAAKTDKNGKTGKASAVTPKRAATASTEGAKAAGRAPLSAVKALKGKSPGKSPIASGTRAAAAAKKAMRAE